jgi:hypothetical protein
MKSGIFVKYYIDRTNGWHWRYQQREKLSAFEKSSNEEQQMSLLVTEMVEDSFTPA